MKQFARAQNTHLLSVVDHEEKRLWHATRSSNIRQPRVKSEPHRHVVNRCWRQVERPIAQHKGSRRFVQQNDLLHRRASRDPVWQRLHNVFIQRKQWITHQKRTSSQLPGKSGVAWPKSTDLPHLRSGKRAASSLACIRIGTSGANLAIACEIVVNSAENRQKKMARFQTHLINEHVMHRVRRDNHDLTLVDPDFENVFESWCVCARVS